MDGHWRILTETRSSLDRGTEMRVSVEDMG